MTTTTAEALATTVHLTAQADQIAARLVSSTPGRGHLACDALDPCVGCKVAKAQVRALRRAAR